MSVAAPGMLCGRWSLDALLGKGGFAEVWRAVDAQDPARRAAIKIATDDAFVAHLRNERLDLDHPAVVKTLEVALDHDPPYVAFELMEGGTLRSVLAERG